MDDSDSGVLICIVLIDGIVLTSVLSSFSVVLMLKLFTLFLYLFVGIIEELVGGEIGRRGLIGICGDVWGKSFFV